MVNFSFIYKELFQSNKIKHGSKILNIFFQNNTTVSFNIKNIIDNEIHLTKLGVSFENIVYDSNKDQLFDFLDDFHYDVIIICNIFSFCEMEKINDILKVLVEKSPNSYFMFINEIIYNSFQNNYNPISYIRNGLYKLSSYNFGKSIGISEVYDFIYKNNLNILDASRILSHNKIPTYPVEYFLIICYKR